ncbi:hypothetical protein SUGI_0188160 [Cryptomeria japonica]|uniref:PHD finger protein MALE MEIOCYTE DEATH 1 n=1 Tax=Cryptomeria japonica TaxID=3369 RepID=UPI002408E701|nr:PHD finger protein MALE MEIOCYTE DEATH 1 [Cryptomeria japonica]GLJ12291.1 hypothetical protein SUGI_0188160 [Cryptomeria japonica]
MYVNCQNRRKRKRGEKLFDFQTFGDPGCPADYDLPFRDNIRVFLEECAEREPYNIDGNPAWIVLLQGETQSAIIPLHVVEENALNSPNPHCDQCRCVGWSHHLVSKRRYHFLIAAPEIAERPLGLAAAMVGTRVCPNCHDRVSNISSCLTCGEKVVQGRTLDLHTHLLHGVIHGNGFGHLLCINGREKGSKYASGRHIMDFWDRMCSMLRARKVSVEDLAKKRSMAFRLLNCAAYGQSWYGRWGYVFGHGSFGVTPQMYSKAIEAVRGIPLKVMMQHFQGVDTQVLEIVHEYQRISRQELQTVGDLFRYMLELKARLPLQSSPSTSGSTTMTSDNGSTKSFTERNALNSNHIAAYTQCRWSVKRLELAAQVVVDALRNCSKDKMSRQDVRDVARLHIGDTGLLDFVLKSLGNRIVGDSIVRRAVNPATKILEYSLEDVNKVESVDHFGCGVEDPLWQVRRTEVERDIFYLYKHVLENYKPARKGFKTVSNGTNSNILMAIPTATKIILDTKQFIKDYKGEMTRKGAHNEWAIDEDEMLRVLCNVVVMNKEKNNHMSMDMSMTNRPLPPAEMVVLPPHATIGELKEEAQRALRDTYIVTENLVVEGILDLQGDDDDLLFGTLESGSTVMVQGTGIDVSSDLRYEGGADDWTVDCPCGAKDDDGERMIACDMCEVWQHTRCAGICDADAVPQLFLCNRCGMGLYQAIL